MSRFLASLHLDENIDRRVADVVRSRGYDVTTSAEVGLLGADDAAQLAWAAEQQRAIVTHNRADFEALAARCMADSQSHAGIVIMVRRPDPRHLADLLPATLNRLTADELDNNVVYL